MCAPILSSAPTVEMVQYQKSEDMLDPSLIRQLAEERGFIAFYNENDPLTEWLGNFYPISVEYNGSVYSNSEAAYQAQKFIHDPDLFSQFTTFTA